MSVPFFSTVSITRGDFNIFDTTWKELKNGEKWPNGAPKYLVDMSTGDMKTGRKYWNESKDLVSFKCLLLILGTPIYHFMASLLNVAYRIVKLVSFFHFWVDKEGEKSYSLKERFKDAGQDLLRIVVTPIAIIGLEFTAIYGVFSPYNGRKLYASIERAQYERYIVAPCFQPDPNSHLFRSDPKIKGGL